MSERNPLGELEITGPHKRSWHFRKRTALYTKLDGEVKISSKNKLKPKPKTEPIKIRRKIMRQIDLTGKYQKLDIKASSDDRLVEWYNAHSGSSIKLARFANRAVAEKKCQELMTAMDQLAAGVNADAVKTRQQKEEENNMAKKNKAAKATKGSKTSGSNGKGRNSKLLDQVIYKLQNENPRREGTAGAKSWGLIRDGMTYREFIDKGGRNIDLRCEIENGRAVLQPAGGKVPAKNKPAKKEAAAAPAKKAAKKAPAKKAAKKAPAKKNGNGNGGQEVANA